MFDASRRKKSALIFMSIALFFVACFVYLIIESPEATGLTAFSFGYPSLLIFLRILFQKKHKMRRSTIKVIGIAPTIIWLEHLALCSALGAGLLWANEMQGFQLMAPNMFTGFFCLSMVASVWPYMNHFLLKRQPQRFGYKEFEKKTLF